jgi:hypothetical protein
MLNFLQPDAEHIAPVEHKPTHDHGPEELALGTPVWLRDDLVEMLGEDQVHSRAIDLVKYASDASLSLPKMLSGANAFEISDIERMNIGAHQPGAWHVTMSYERRCQVKKHSRGRTPHIFLDIQP